MAVKFLLKFLSFPLRILTFILAIYIVAASGYHIQRLNSNNLSPSAELYAIIIIAGAAALYAAMTALIACFFPRGGFILFLLLDLIFCGGFVAIAVLLRDAVTETRCAEGVWTESGSTYDKGLDETCGVDKAAFATAVANAVFFAILALLSFFIHQNQSKNRAFGPGPDNNYSVHGSEKPGRKKSIWGRRRHAQPVGEPFANSAAGFEPDDGRYTREYRGTATPAAGMGTTAGYGQTAGMRYSMGESDVSDGYARKGGAGGFDPELGHTKRESLGLGGQPTRTYDAF
ncbi:hypothetical protein EX30DRAFT_396836 [Ascodesmis nigricans]|uniref:MARVEL domain-containing protein n=1 Tax=Ascodesmis nigricans TaxID=341454 RepID=A0A4S2MTE7_9PEZI|nr:hypothetical protein EX30DRAFT_396836 [Ascodesmis nigricans]